MQERIDVDDLPGVRVENQDAVLGGFEEAAVARLGRFQGVFMLLALGDVDEADDENCTWPFASRWPKAAVSAEVACLESLS